MCASQSPLWSQADQMIDATAATGTKRASCTSPLGGGAGGRKGRAEEEGSPLLYNLGVISPSPPGQVMSLHGRWTRLGVGVFGSVLSPAWFQL